MSDHIANSETQEAPTGRFKPLVSLMQHKWLILFILVFFNLLAIPVAEKLGQPIYKVKGLILVSPKFIPNLNEPKGINDLRGEGYDLYVSQQVHMATRGEVIKEAFNSPGIKELWMQPGESEEFALIRLKLAVEAKNVRKTPFVEVKLKTSYAKGIHTVLNAVLDAYLKRAQAETLYNSDERIALLQKRRDHLAEFIPRLYKTRTQIAKELGVTTFQENRLNPYDNILIDTTSAFNLAQRQLVETEARLKALNSKEGRETVLDILAKQMLHEDSTLKTIKGSLMQRRSELLNQSVGLTSKHPGKQRVDKAIAEIDKEIASTEKELFQNFRQQLLQQAKAEVIRARNVVQSLANELNTQKDRSTRYASRYNEAIALNKEIERAQRQLDEVNVRIDFMKLEASAPGYVRIDSYATPTLKPERGGKDKYFLLFGLASVMLALVIPIFIDMSDKRIRAPVEIQNCLGFAPLAWILDRKTATTDDFSYDQIRRLAFALDRDRRTHQNRCFAFTSVKPGGGTSSLILETAKTLNELGIKTLAMEINAFKPDERYEGNTPHSLTSLLSQNTYQLHRPETLVSPATEDLPERLSVGEVSQQHLITYGKLPTLLNNFYNYYDMILLDSPPILLSADAELLGEVAGCILLVIEAGQVTPGELQRAAHLLERLSPPVVGAIMNRVQVYQGGGYLSDLVKEYSSRSKLKPGLLKRMFWT